MSIIRDVVSSTLNNTIYNSGFIQVPEVQAMAAGAIAVRQGWQLFRNPTAASLNSSLIGRAGRKAAGITMMGTGLAGLGYGMWYGRQSLASSSLNSSCARILFNAVGDKQYKLFQQETEDVFNHHIRGQRVNGSYIPNPMNAFCRENKKFCQNEGLRTSDNPVKTLVLGASASIDVEHHALKVTGSTDLRQRYWPMFYEVLDPQADVTYRTILNPNQICEEIQQASKTGPVETLILSAHGSPSLMRLDWNSWVTIFDPLPANCFDDLAPWANIFLLSCSTGAQSLLHPNIAEMISWSSGKEVIAPTEPLSGLTVVVNGIQCVAGTEGVGQTVDFGQEFSVVHELFDSPLIHERSFLEHFNVTSSWEEQARFLSKWIVPTALGVVTVWQTARLGATLLQGGGATIEFLTDKSAPLLHRLTQKVGLYNPSVAGAFYGATKSTGHILNRSGQAIHAAMDATFRAPIRAVNWSLKTVAKMMRGALNLSSFYK